MSVTYIDKNSPDSGAIPTTTQVKTTSTTSGEVQHVNLDTIASNYISSDGNAVLTQEQHDEDVRNGKHFFVKDFMDVATTDSPVDFLWVTPSGSVVPHASWNIAGKAEFKLELYECATSTDYGTAITVFNSNRNSTDTATVAAYSSPNISATGTKVWGGKIGSGRDAAEGGGSHDDFIGAAGTVYLLRITKIAANTQWMDYHFGWRETT